jgi:hypothetical protein
MSHITGFDALNIQAVFMLDMQNVSIGQIDKILLW